MRKLRQKDLTKGVHQGYRESAIIFGHWQNVDPVWYLHVLEKEAQCTCHFTSDVYCDVWKDIVHSSEKYAKAFEDLYGITQEEYYKREQEERMGWE